MNKLKTFRQMHKKKQTELAKVLNTTQQQISLYENQKRKLNEDQIATLIKVYHAEIGDLLELGTMEEKETQQNNRFGAQPTIRKGNPLIFSGFPFLLQLS